MRILHASLDGPIPGPISLDYAAYDLAGLGYVTQEWFLRGGASSYRAAGGQARHGRWDAVPDAEAEFHTRLVVIRPSDPASFNGTVVLEWMNVSGGRDVATDWLYTHRHILRTGAAWVGVSAQRAGISGGGLQEAEHLKIADPDRYGALQHPGDAYAFDIYSQAAAAVRAGGLLSGLEVGTVLGVGESQSAIFLVTYVNSVDPQAQLIDGFLLHGRGASGAWLDGTLWDPKRLTTDLLRHQPTLPGHHIRADVRVPVLTVQSETDVVLMAGVLARQRDTDLTRQWEIAGAAHFDTYGLRAGYVDDGTLSPQELHRLQRPQLSPRGYHTSSPVNGAPQHHYVLQAALASLEDWARGGPPAPAANVFDTHKFQPLRLQRDSHGIVRGGVRTPWVDAPVATYSGLGQRVRGFGILFGSTRAWSAREVATRYPGGPDQYRSEFDAALGASVDAGFLLPEDREEATALGHLSWPDVNEETP